jgi:hypothetical protein
MGFGFHLLTDTFFTFMIKSLKDVMKIPASAIEHVVQNTTLKDKEKGTCHWQAMKLGGSQGMIHS